MSSFFGARARVEQTVTGEFDAVLPLHSADLSRAERLLVPSLLQFMAPLRTCWVITPDDAVADVASRLRDSRISVLAEHDVVPELRWFKRQREFGEGSSEGLRGWFVQQMIKLSMARRVETPFYLTLDADVLCCRPIAYSDLIQDGRGLTVVSANGDQSHAKWYEQSARLLGMPRSERTHGVTPVILNVEAVRHLLAFFEQRLHPNQLRAEAFLLSHIPWTEYSLYFTYLERTDQFDRFHVATRTRTYGNNVWGGQDPAAWHPEGSFAPDGPLFSVLQSHTMTDVDDILAKIRAHFATTGRRSPV